MVSEVIARARQRLLWNALAVEAVHAFSLAMLLLIAAMLLGMELSHWRWLALPPAITLAARAWVAHRRRAAPYVAAQLVDSRLKLADTLSTAVFFSSVHTRAPASDMHRAQFASASLTAARLDIRQAIPFELPRAWAASVLLAAGAGGLFAVRYGILQTLHLRLPAPAILRALLQDPEKKSADDQELAKYNREDANQNSGTSQPDADIWTDSSDGDAASQSGRGGEREPREDSAASGSSEKEAEESKEGGQEQTSSDSEGTSKSEHTSRSEQKANAPDSNSGMFSKLKNTMSNLLSAMKPQRDSRSQSGNQNSSRQRGRPNGKQAAGGHPQSADAGDANDPQQGEPGADPQQAGAQSGKGKESSSQTAEGAGREDGAKALKLAEQAEAMGKISTILGKRAENVTGTAEVETSSANDELATPYAHRNAQHSRVETKSDRDDVPQVFEAYVQEYFNRVRENSHKRTSRKIN